MKIVDEQAFVPAELSVAGALSSLSTLDESLPAFVVLAMGDLSNSNASSSTGISWP